MRKNNNNKENFKKRALLLPKTQRDSGKSQLGSDVELQFGRVFVGPGFSGTFALNVRRWVENPHHSDPINGLKNGTFWCREWLWGVGAAVGGLGEEGRNGALPGAHRFVLLRLTVPLFI